MSFNNSPRAEYTDKYFAATYRFPFSSVRKPPGTPSILERNTRSFDAAPLRSKSKASTERRSESATYRMRPFGERATPFGRVLHFAIGSKSPLVVMRNTP